MFKTLFCIINLLKTTMKKNYISAIIFLLFVSISLAGALSNIDNLFPLSVGNKWVYKKGNETIVEEIVEKRIVYYDNYFDEELEVYVFHRNGAEKELKAYREKKGTVFVKLDKSTYTDDSPSFIRHQTFIPNLPVEGWSDPKEAINRNVKYVWVGKETISVPAGVFETFVNEFRFEDGKKFLRNYYAYKIGLVKTALISTKGDTLEQTELVEYLTKED